MLLFGVVPEVTSTYSVLASHVNLYVQEPSRKTTAEKGDRLTPQLEYLSHKMSKKVLSSWGVCLNSWNRQEVVSAHSFTFIKISTVKFPQTEALI